MHHSTLQLTRPKGVKSLHSLFSLLISGNLFPSAPRCSCEASHLPVEFPFITHLLAFSNIAINVSAHIRCGGIQIDCSLSVTEFCHGTSKSCQTTQSILGSVLNVSTHLFPAAHLFSFYLCILFTVSVQTRSFFKHRYGSYPRKSKPSRREDEWYGNHITAKCYLEVPLNLTPIFDQTASRFGTCCSWLPNSCNSAERIHGMAFSGAFTSNTQSKLHSFYGSSLQTLIVWKTWKVPSTQT